MKIGFVGLGKMGANMCVRLLERGQKIAAYDIDKKAVRQIARKGGQPADSLEDLVKKLPRPRAVWVMLPAGKITVETVGSLFRLMDKGDIIIDGGNSYYKDSVNMAVYLKTKGIHFLDAGTSGGTWGLKNGYCLMVGGDPAAFRKVEPVFQALAPKDGYALVGPNGAGHFVKMVHNGIEYGLMEAYAEGFEIMEAKKEFGLDLARICRLWNQGSVVRSWLLELSAGVFVKDPHLRSIAGYVADTGEGRWTIAEAIERNVPAPAITMALLQRIRSRQKESFGSKVVAALRNAFGGHAVKKE